MQETSSPTSGLQALLRDKRAWYVLLFVVAAYLGSRKILTRYTDLQIWIDLSHDVAADVDLYRFRGAGKSPFLWPPVVALFFHSATALLSNTGFLIAFGISQAVATILLLDSLVKIVQGQFREPIPVRTWVVIWAFFALTIGRAIDQSYTHGQIALWTGALITYATWCLIDGRPARAGVMFGIAAVIKLTPLLFLPGLLVIGARRAAGVMAAVVLGLVLVLPWPFLGTHLHARHLGDFYECSIRSIWAPEARVHEVWLQGDHNIRGTVTTLFRSNDPLTEERRPTIVELPMNVVNGIVLVYSGAIGLVLLLGLWRFRRGPPEWRYAWQCSFLMFGLLLYSPATHLYHFAGLTLPVILFLAHGPGNGWRRVSFYAICTGMAVATSLRQEALLGEELWAWLHHAGVMHFSTVALLIWTVTLPQPGEAAGSEGTDAEPSRVSSRKGRAEQRKLA